MIKRFFILLFTTLLFANLLSSQTTKYFGDSLLYVQSNEMFDSIGNEKRFFELLAEGKERAEKINNVHFKNVYRKASLAKRRHYFKRSKASHEKINTSPAANRDTDKRLFKEKTSILGVRLLNHQLQIKHL